MGTIISYYFTEPYQGLLPANAVRNKFRVWFGKPGDEDDNDPIQSAEDVFGSRPDDEIDRARSMDKLDEAIRQLPARQ